MIEMGSNCPNAKHERAARSLPPMAVLVALLSLEMMAQQSRKIA